MIRICTICARGGSKGVPNKNLRLLFGKPLLAYAIEQARNSGLFQRVAVSSDSDDILVLANSVGVDDLIQRPPELATDVAAKPPAIHHALVTVEQRHGIRFDTLVDLDATSPLRTSADIVGVVKLLESSLCACVITGTPSRHSPYFSLVERYPDGRIDSAKKLQEPIVRRQDAPLTYDMDGAVFAWDAARFRADPKVFYADTRLYEMPAERSHDIDSELDFVIVELLMRRQLGL